jgi:hypothetical protein
MNLSAVVKTAKLAWQAWRRARALRLPFNYRLQAYNVFEIPVDQLLITRAGEFYAQHIAPRLDSEGSWRSDGWAFYVKRPTGWSSDISWWTADDAPTYHWFETTLFQKVGLGAPFSDLIDHDVTIRLYSPSFVVRSRCKQTQFHQDYSWEFGTNAYTLMTPLADMSAVPDGHLNYMDIWGRRRVYRYRMGTAVVFGAGFVHGTQPVAAGPPRAFLCLTFGSDKALYWPHVQASVGTQGRLVCHPNGTLMEGTPTARY